MNILLMVIVGVLAYKVQRTLEKIRAYHLEEGASPRPLLIGKNHHWGNGIAIHVYWIAFLPVHQHQHYHSTLLLD